MRVSPQDVQFKVVGTRKVKGVETYGVVAKGFPTRAAAEAATNNAADEVIGYVSDDYRIRARILHDAKSTALREHEERNRLVAAQEAWDAANRRPPRQTSKGRA